IALLKRILGAGVPVIRFAPDDLRSLSPLAFVNALAGELLLSNFPSIPQAQQTESTSRWISHELPGWLAQQMAADQTKNPSRYPVWVALAGLVREATRLSGAADLPDLVSPFMGPPDSSSQPAPELPHLRWLLLGGPNTVFPPTRMPIIVDDLTAAVNTD